MIMISNNIEHWATADNAPPLIGSNYMHDDDDDDHGPILDLTNSTSKSVTQSVSVSSSIRVLMVAGR